MQSWIQTIGPDLVTKVVVTLAAAPVLWAIAKLTRLSVAWITGRSRVALGHSIHDFVPASERDLPELLSLYRRYFGDDIPTLSVMRSWLNRSPRAFWLVLDRSSRASSVAKLVGSFKLLPITRSGVSDLEADLVSGSTFRERHIARRPRDTAAYYIGDVIGTNRVAQAAIVSHLRQLVSTNLTRLPVYARPLSRDGERLMSKLGFHCVADGGEPTLRRICRMDSRTTSPRSRARQPGLNSPRARVSTERLHVVDPPG